MCDKQSVEQRPVCQFFAKRQCKKGRSCRFLHVITLDRSSRHHQDASELESSLATEEYETGEPLQSSVPRNQRNDQRRQICRHFLQKGWCRFGRTCAYLHTVPQQKTLDSEPGCQMNKDESQSADLAGHDISDDMKEEGTRVDLVQPEETAGGQKPISNSEKVCKFYKAGYCRLGWRCHFKHASHQHGSSRDGHPDRRRFNAVQFKTSGPGSLFGADDRRSVHSETSSDSGITEDFLPRTKPDFSVEVIKEADEGKISGAATSKTFNPNCGENKEATARETLRNLRKIEIEQLKKRFPNAKEVTTSEDQTTIHFIFVPTDPDWPYDVREMLLQVGFPADYPSQMMNIVMLDDERTPDTVRRLVTEGIQEWVASKFETMKWLGKSDLAFRPFLRWFDKNAEALLTDALKEFRRERMAETAGVHFLSADQLRRKYKLSDREEQEQEQVEGRIENKGVIQVQRNDGELDGSKKETTVQVMTMQEKEKMKETKEEVMMMQEKENLSDKENSATVNQSSQSMGTTSKRGTEVALQNFQLLNCAATLLATNVSLMISCARCSNKAELKAKAGQLSKVECPYCHEQQLIMFRETMAHQFSSVIGYLDLERCDVFDMILSDSQFIVNCLECSKDNKLEALPPGQLNMTWCQHCHSKLTVAANNARFVKLSAAVSIDSKNACTVEVQGRIKAVKDPAIVEGKPLPNNGTCKHFKKSFRWFRFPCCGKAYPCDSCHDEKEAGHEMKLANRIICGFCAKEQPYSSDHPCVGCHAIITNRTTDHWEGGTGCRDKLKMSRGDSKKYADSLKTASRSSQSRKDPGKKITKLRHI